MSRHAVLLAAAALICAGPVMMGMPGQGWLGLVLSIAMLVVLSGLLWLAGQDLGTLSVCPGLAPALAAIALGRIVWSGEKQAQMAHLRKACQPQGKHHD